MPRRREPEPVEPARGPLEVPDVLRLGALSECWSDTGHEHDLGSAWTNFGRGRQAWGAAEGLTGEQVRDLVPGGAPWSIEVPAWQRESGRPYDDPAERLDRLGLHDTDLPALRQAAHALIPTADTHRRTT